MNEGSLAGVTAALEGYAEAAGAIAFVASERASYTNRASVVGAGAV